MNCRCRASARHERRHGLTLLEVVLALAILVGALAALGGLADIGMRSAREARELTRAQILCETKLAELSSGIVPLAAVQSAQLEYDPDWRYSVQIEQTDEIGLIALHVTVQQNLPGGGRPLQFSLSRWIVDPGVDLPEQPEEDEAEEATTEDTTETPGGGLNGF